MSDTDKISKPAAVVAGAVGLAVFVIAPISLFVPFLPLAAGTGAGVKVYEFLTKKRK